MTNDKKEKMVGNRWEIFNHVLSTIYSASYLETWESIVLFRDDLERDKEYDEEGEGINLMTQDLWINW